MSSEQVKIRIIGPPGCGKTKTLLDLLEQEIYEGTATDRIAFLTFTRAAREEALSRTGKTAEEFPYLKTIHSICYHQLAIGKDQIVRPQELGSFGKKLGLRITGATHDPWIEEFDRGIDQPTRDDILIQVNHHGRHRKIMLREALQNISPEIDYKYAVWFTKAYRSWKDANGYLDYTDLLAKYIEYGKPLDVDVLFVDEAQDLSALQWEAVFKLAQNAKVFYLAGDDDQSIFQWAGADSHVFQDIEVNDTRVLSQSHRVSKSVHKAAMRVVSRIRKRLPKEYSPTDSEGEVLNAGALGTINFRENSFILFRNHYRGAAIVQQLRDDKIPFVGRGSVLNDSSVRMAFYGFHSLLRNGKIDSRIMKHFLRYADEDYLQGGLRELAKTHKEIDINRVFIEIPKPQIWHKVLGKMTVGDELFELVRNNGFLRVATPKVEVLSIHQSKGREANTVYIDPEMSKASWLGMLANPDDEHRVWYVGLTRAKEKIYFLMPDGHYNYRF